MDNLHWTERPGVLGEIIAEEVERGKRELVRRGMGEPPVSEERLEEIRSMWAILYRGVSGSQVDDEMARQISEISKKPVGVAELLEVIDHLQARIAFLCNDSEAWADGYQRGLEDGKRAGQTSVIKLPDWMPGDSYE